LLDSLFVLRSVRDIPAAAGAAYWDGGITDYHPHLNYNASDLHEAAVTQRLGDSLSPKSSPWAQIVLYPHFRRLWSAGLTKPEMATQVHPLPGQQRC
jgi:hypothetical protein